MTSWVILGVVTIVAGAIVSWLVISKRQALKQAEDQKHANRELWKRVLGQPGVDAEKIRAEIAAIKTKKHEEKSAAVLERVRKWPRE